MEINFRQIITLKLISSNYHNTYVRLERDNTVLVIIFSVCRFMNCIRVHFHDLIIINKRLIIEFRQHDCYLSMSIIDTQNRRRVETSTRRIIVNLNFKFMSEISTIILTSIYRMKIFYYFWRGWKRNIAFVLFALNTYKICWKVM